MLLILLIWCAMLVLAAFLPWVRWLFITVAAIELLLGALVFAIVRAMMHPDWNDSPLEMYGVIVVMLFMASLAVVFIVRYFYRHVTRKNRL